MILDNKGIICGRINTVKKVYRQLIKRLIKILDGFDYAILSPDISDRSVVLVKIALRTTDRISFLRELKEATPFQIVLNKLDKTVLIAELETDKYITFELYHFFHSDRLTYLDIEEVLRHRTYNGVHYIPAWEHLLEFAILNSFLNEEGLGQDIIDGFKDLHVFLQEDLLDNFNAKYDTAFNSIYDLRDYRPTIESHLQKRLKTFPSNKFAKRVQLRWLNIKRLLKRSAVY